MISFPYFWKRFPCYCNLAHGREQWLGSIRVWAEWPVQQSLNSSGEKDFNQRGGEEGGADCLTTPGEGTCWRGRGLMNTGEWLSYGSGPAGKIRGLVLILNETLLLFIEGVTRSSTYLYPSFYLSAQYSFLRSEWLLVAESGRHSSCSCLQ